MIFWIFVNIFRVLFFYFLYSLEIIHIPIIQTNFGKYLPDFHFLLKIFSIFFFMILSSDIFLFPFKISQKLVRKIFTVHTFSVAEKVARSFTASFRGIHLFLLTFSSPPIVQTPKSSRDSSSKLVRKIHIGTLLL
jgi:hypothetical protein